MYIDIFKYLHGLSLMKLNVTYMEYSWYKNPCMFEYLAKNSCLKVHFVILRCYFYDIPQ